MSWCLCCFDTGILAKIKGFVYHRLGVLGELVLRFCNVIFVCFLCVSIGPAGRELHPSWTNLQALHTNKMLNGTFFKEQFNALQVIIILQSRTLMDLLWTCLTFSIRAQYAFKPKEVNLHKTNSSADSAGKLTESEIKGRINRLSQILANKVLF